MRFTFLEYMHVLMDELVQRRAERSQLARPTGHDEAYTSKKGFYYFFGVLEAVTENLL